MDAYRSLGRVDRRDSFSVESWAGYHTAGRDSNLSRCPTGVGEVVFNFRTNKMRSRSASAVPFYDPTTRELRFRYFFETEPTAASNDANPLQQFGSALACVQLDKPDRMRIRYTNERSPGGDIALRRRRKKEAARVSV